MRCGCLVSLEMRRENERIAIVFERRLKMAASLLPRSRLMKHVINGETAFLVRRASIFTIIRGFSLLKHLRTI
jgi:hypothetical protein